MARFAFWNRVVNLLMGQPVYYIHQSTYHKENGPYFECSLGCTQLICFLYLCLIFRKPPISATNQLTPLVFDLYQNTTPNPAPTQATPTTPTTPVTPTNPVTPTTPTTPAAPAPKQGGWCVPKSGVSDAQLQANLDYACGHGIDCSFIQPGGACFAPNTVASHAAFAMNLLYQTAGRNPWNCNFSETATLTSSNPSKLSTILASF